MSYLATENVQTRCSPDGADGIAHHEAAVGAETNEGVGRVQGPETVLGGLLRASPIRNLLSENRTLYLELLGREDRDCEKFVLGLLDRCSVRTSRSACRV